MSYQFNVGELSESVSDVWTDLLDEMIDTEIADATMSQLALVELETIRKCILDGNICKESFLILLDSIKTGLEL